MNANTGDIFSSSLGFQDDSPAPAVGGGGANVPEYSVSGISHALKRTVEQTYGFVKVRGEISGFKRPSSGHWYFSLKDESSVLSAVCWRTTASRMGMVPQDGMEVVVTGKITTYGPRSSYQIVIDSLEPAGEGALLKILEDRKKKLESEGLFAAHRKKPIPHLPTVIGVVTSPTGAVIRDILHRINDRFPRRVLLWGVPVQGQGAEIPIANAITGFNQLPPRSDTPHGDSGDNGDNTHNAKANNGENAIRPDVIIVARGGGSLEDLWAFNEECVVRAVANSDIPVVSAVGHETDTTLIDFASDQRAPTPTAAAEMVVPVRLHLQQQVHDLHYRLHQTTAHGLQHRITYIDALAKALPDTQTLMGHAEHRLDDIWGRVTTHINATITHHRHRVNSLALQLTSPADIMAQKRQAVDQYGERLSLANRQNLKGCQDRLNHLALQLTSPADSIAHKTQAVAYYGERLSLANRQNLKGCQDRLNHRGALLESYSYRNVLQRGFAVVRHPNGTVIQSAPHAKQQPSVTVEFYDGQTTLYSQGKGESPALPEQKTATKESKITENQRDLF